MTEVAPWFSSFQMRDAEWKMGYDSEWIHSFRIYEDCSRTETIAALSKLGAGIKDNPHPLEVGLLRRVVDRLAAVYAEPPTRWFERSGQRIDYSSVEAVKIRDILTESRYDLVMRRADRLRALMRQCAIRIYPNDATGSCVLRVFEPFNIYREPSALTPDSLDADTRFGLRVNGDRNSNLTNQIWEMWERSGDRWTMRMLDGHGTPLREQPMAAYEGLVSPYVRLPVHMLYDDEPAGRAWLPPRFSRTAWVNALNGMANDLWALVLNEAHSQTVVRTDDTKNVPKTAGPNTIWVLPMDAIAEVLNKSTKLAEAQGVLDNFVRLWTLTEDLPTAELDKSKQVVTGAAARAQMAPLLARRNDQIPLAYLDERALFERFRAVHNVHVAAGTGKWARLDAYLIAEDLVCVPEFGDLNIPTEAAESQDEASRGIMLGTMSVIDQIQRERRCNRDEAIKHYERVREDLKKYPTHAPTESLMVGKQAPNTEKKFGTNSMSKGAANASNSADLTVSS